MTTPTKRCTGPCKQEKPLTDFVRNRSKPGGRSAYCRECSNLLQRQRHAKRKTDGERVWKQTPSKGRHVCTKKCVKRDYGNGKPICFRAYFQDQRDRRNGVFLTDNRNRTRTRNNARAKVRQ